MKKKTKNAITNLSKLKKHKLQDQLEAQSSTNTKDKKLMGITVPETPDYMVQLIISRHIQNLAYEISHLDHTTQDVFRRYLKGEDQKQIPDWDKYKKDLLYYADRLFPKIQIKKDKP